MAHPYPDDHFVVGRVEKPHGIKGEVGIRVITDNNGRFAPRQILHSTHGRSPLTVLSTRRHKQALLVRFVEIQDRTAAEALRGAWLSVPEADVPPPAPGTWWIHDIVGSSVTTDAGLYLGVVTDVTATGANDVWEVSPAPELGLGQPILLPAIREVVTEVDIPGRSVVVHLLPGLLPK
ncbi:MAG: 16S rRNA processing protein RimM [Caldilineaceae bacterium]|nr:16S rRNA processing protein RimM [Caldilineaceae bacterium]